MTKWINIILFIIILLIISNCIAQHESFQNNRYRYGLVLCCYNRPQYLKKTLDSLQKSNLNNCILCIIDDDSKDVRTKRLIRDFDIENVRIIKHTNKYNIGIHNSLLKGFDIVYPLCQYLVNIDSDVIMKPDWLQKLDHSYLDYKKIFKKECIVTGFNCVNSCQHKIIKRYPSFYVKKSIGGINMYFHTSLYLNQIRKILLSSKKKRSNWDWKVVSFAHKNNINLIATKPSVIQHIGTYGLNSSGRYDIAEDF